MEVGQGPNWGCSAKEKNGPYCSPQLDKMLTQFIHFPLQDTALMAVITFCVSDRTLLEKLTVLHLVNKCPTAA
jgi:hypothetical protein